MEKDIANHGFTLIEALLALALVSVLVLGTGEVLIHALAVKKSVDEQMEACSLGAAKIEQLKASRFESAALAAGDGSEEIRGASVAAVFTREWRIEDVSDGLKRAEVAVFSRSRPGRKVRMALLLLRELEF
jgi:prepilin-type N-terminal cleavage/methylation domain-containing protein